MFDAAGEVGEHTDRGGRIGRSVRIIGGAESAHTQSGLSDAAAGALETVCGTRLLAVLLAHDAGGVGQRAVAASGRFDGAQTTQVAVAFLADTRSAREQIA